MKFSLHRSRSRQLHQSGATAVLLVTAVMVTGAESFTDSTSASPMQGQEPVGSAPILGCVGHAALSGDRVIFESAGDLWMARVPVSGDGGGDGVLEASRLTSGAGVERWPTISPDGSLVAFVGEYDGNPEVYVMPVSGGVPTRLTFHPGRDIPLGWTPDGTEILFRSQRLNPQGMWELFRVPVTGGAATREPIGECSLASIDPRTGRLAFTRWSNESWNWRGYRGGTAPELWVTGPDRAQFTRLTDVSSNELFPSWVAGKLAFLSDRDGTTTIHLMDGEGGSRRVLLPAAESGAGSFDVRRLAADSAPNSTRLVFSQGCRLGIIDADSGAVRRFDVMLVGDRLDERTRLAEPLKALSGMSLSPDGSIAALESRGEVLLVPIGAPTAGRPQSWQQFPRRSETRDFGVAWVSPRALLYVSDRDGTPRLVLRTLSTDGVDQEIEVPTGVREWIFAPEVSLDGRWVAFADKSLRLHLVDLQQGVSRVLATATAGEITDYRFSPDGKLIAWVEPRRTGFSQIRMASTVDQSVDTIVGRGMTMDFEPRWDPAGKFLFFLSKRHIDPLLDAFEFNFVNLNPTVVCALPLAEGTPPPIPAMAAAAGFDLEVWAKPPQGDDAENGSNAEETATVKGAGKQPTPAPVKFEFTASLSDRVALLLIEPGEISSLEAVHGGLLYMRRKPQTLNEEIWPPPPLGVPGAALHRVTLVDGEDTPLITDLSAYAMSRDGSTVLAAAGERLVVLHPGEAHAGGEAASAEAAEALDLSAVRVTVDVRGEWRHIFDEAWRLQRDFFWREDLGGVDWDAVRQRYEALLPRIGSRGELNELIGQMMGELGVSHLYIAGGDDFARPRPISVGLLGVDLERQGDAMVIARILPDFSAEGGPPSPLAAPHLGVAVGEVILAIDGVPLDPARDPHERLVGRGGMPVALTIADDATGAKTRRLEVQALEDDHDLRYRAWVETNRLRVHRESNGRLGYIHLPDMDSEGLTAFVRQFYPQLDREGMVIDVRGNGGGFVSQMIIERLARRIYAWSLPRHGAPETYPQRVMDGPIAVIIDQHAGSDGDIFPESVRIRDLGPLIGKRTWGGVIGIRQDKPFIDGGSASQPEYAWWEPLRGFDLENTGVAPDIEVDITPPDRVAGRDPQLDRTVQVLLNALRERTPTPVPPRPGQLRATP
ncbi:MAG: PD40 domain-containing protein [Phycisphaeraceae bacterium]|nr:PD40 domain-containing protein [Phycisphaeraceae bacterium]